jgi:acyl carrier protein
MTVMENLEKIFRDVFDDEDILINVDMTANDIDEWDSLAQIRLILQIEKRFSLHFDASEIEKLENVGQMAELISLKQAND